MTETDGAAGGGSPKPAVEMRAMGTSNIQAAILKGMASSSGSGNSAGTFTNALLAGMRTGARRASLSTKMSNWMKGRQQRRLENGVDMGVVKAIPVREALQGLFRVARAKSLRDAFMFFCIAGLFVGLTYLIHDTHESFLSTQALTNAFTDQEFANVTYKKNFFDIHGMDDFWNWAFAPMDVNEPAGTVAAALYDPDNFVNDTSGASPPGYYLLNYYRLVGTMQFRQIRTTNSSCKERRFLEDTSPINGKGRYDSTDGTCYAEFTGGDGDTTPFGPNGMYTWSTGHSELDGLTGFGPSYGKGGYVTEISFDPDVGPQQLAQLRANKWIDRGTRAVSVGFNLYDTNTRLVVVCRFVIEFSTSGFVNKFAKLYPFRIAVYRSFTSDRTDGVHLILQGLYALFIIYFLQKEARRIWNSRPMVRYFSHPTNIFEALLVFMNAMFYLQFFNYLFARERTQFSVNDTAFKDLFDLAEKYMDIYTTASFLGLMYSIKTFRYFSISKKLSTLWLTLERAGPDLAAFLIGFLIVVVGFSLFGFFSFGFNLESFHSISASFSTLLRFPLGDFNYEALISARPRISPIFFALYVSIVFFVMMNIVIAIVTRYFEEVHAEAIQLDRWKQATPSPEADLWGLIQVTYAQLKNRLCPRFQPAGAKHDSAEGALFDEANRDDFLRRREFENRLHVIMRLAKQIHSVNLYAYFERVYKYRGPKSLYIGIHELCSLSRQVPCEPGTHKTCEASKLMAAYTGVKNVVMVGRAHQHTPLASQARIDPTSNKYRVYKYNRHGMLQRRVIVINAAAQTLFTYSSTRLDVRSKLMLSGLAQVESGTCDPLLLRLQFVNQRPSGSTKGKRERLLAVRFLSPEAKRQFVSELTSSLDARIQALEAEGLMPQSLLQFESIVESMERGAGIRAAAAR